MKTRTKIPLKSHPLQLPPRSRKAELKLTEGLVIGQEVLYNGLQSYIISIYPNNSPLAGFVLIAGIGSPIKASQIAKNSTTFIDH